HAAVARDPVDEHRAGAAGAAVAHHLGAGDAQLLAQRRQQGHVRLDVQGLLLAVEGELQRRRPRTYRRRPFAGAGLLRALLGLVGWPFARLAAGEDGGRADPAEEAATRDADLIGHPLHDTMANLPRILRLAACPTLCTLLHSLLHSPVRNTSF